jgi:hypothetical protein
MVVAAPAADVKSEPEATSQTLAVLSRGKMVVISGKKK